ncbi:MAG: YcxB family protein [Bacteroidia bacterium]
MITTNKIELTKWQYFKILASNRFSQSWYMYLLPFIAALIIHFTMEEPEMLVKFLVVYGFIYPGWILIYLTIHVNSNRVSSVSMKRYYEVNNEKIRANHADGSSNEFFIENITEVKQNKNDILLYFSKSEFIYMPYSAFENDDLKQLIEILKKESKIY